MLRLSFLDDSGHPILGLDGKDVVIQFEPVKTCNQFKSCWECLTHASDFDCVWCPSLNSCSDNGLDHNYQVQLGIFWGGSDDLKSP